MILGFILGGLVFGLIAGSVTLLIGFPWWVALFSYASVGFVSILFLATGSVLGCLFRRRRDEEADPVH